MKKFYFIIGAQLIVIVLLGAYAYMQKMEADETRLFLQDARSEAATQKLIAEKEREYAHEQRKKAREKEEQINLLISQNAELAKKHVEAAQKILRESLK